MSGTPHMTGRRAASKSSGDTIAPSELLGDDGKVDTSKVKSITNSNVNKENSVTAEEATEIRRRIRDGEGIVDVAKSVGRAAATVQRHAAGDVEYPDGTPDIGPVECHYFVNAEEATEIRQRLISGQCLKEVAEAHNRSEGTILDHAKNSRVYDDGTPDTNPVVYEHGQWREVSER